jgi:hypothetical protein
LKYRLWDSTHKNLAALFGRAGLGSALAALRTRLSATFKFDARVNRRQHLIITMSHLSNPLATADQLYQGDSLHALPLEIQDSIRYYTARLTQAAGILLRLPQDITARANVLLFRYWTVDDLMQNEFSVRLSLQPPLSFSYTY